MLTPTKAQAPATQEPEIRSVIPAELINDAAIPAVITISGVIFRSLNPKSAAEATRINAAVQTAGGVS
jgi:hypothetical protein